MVKPLTEGLRGRRVFQAGQKIAKALEEELSDPTNWPSLKASFANIRLSRYNLAWLAKVESQTGLRSHNETVTYLIENARRENMALPASLRLIYCDDRPVCVSGPSGTGKSLFLKRILPKITGPIFLVDLADEHTGLKRVGVGEFFEIKWARADGETRLKFVPSSNMDVSRGELRTIFSHLNMLKTDGHSSEKFPSGVLSGWTVIIEEAHRLARERAFQNFMAEGRKFTRKIIVVASDPILYGSICTLLKPPSLEELLSEKH